jgi:YgiT-type zinc finger domain-containing protein
MKCSECLSAELSKKKTSVTLELGVMMVQVEEVPVTVCDTCGDLSVDERTCQQLRELAGRAATRGVGTSVRVFAA